MGFDVDAALNLLIDCCRPDNLDRPSTVLRDRLEQADGARLASLADRHRVEGLLWRTLSTNGVKLTGAAQLATAARRVGAEALRMAMESQRLHAAFARVSLPHLFLKGQAVAKLAWDDVTVKRQSDIDLLVLPEAIGKAAAVLDMLGYVQEVPDPSVDPADWHRSRKESLWRSDDGILLDLHGRVADNPRILSRVTARVRPQMVEVWDGIAIPNLPNDLLLPYLAVHGTSSAWFRLKWIAEFAGIVRRTDPGDLAEIVERGPRIGAGRTLPAAIALSHRLFGTPVPEDMWFDGGAARLVDLAQAAIADPVEPTERPLGTWRIHRSQLLMVPGSHFVVGEAIRQIGERLTR